MRLREDYSAEALRGLAKRSKDANQSRRLLSLAAIRDGMERGEAAKIGGMDRQTLRDWVHRFNAEGPDGLFDHWTQGPTPRLSSDRLAELAAIVETGPNPKTDGVVRWRRVDLQRVISARFGVDYHERSGVDYWAVDFDYMQRREIIKVPVGTSSSGVATLPGFEPPQGELPLPQFEERWTGGYIFENEWQSFRTRQNRDLELITAEHAYDEPGRYTVAVKVIDIFGNDTMTLVPVNVG